MKKILSLIMLALLAMSYGHAQDVMCKVTVTDENYGHSSKRLILTKMDGGMSTEENSIVNMSTNEPGVYTVYGEADCTYISGYLQKCSFYVPKGKYMVRIENNSMYTVNWYFYGLGSFISYYGENKEITRDYNIVGNVDINVW